MKLTPRNKKVISLLLEEHNYVTVRYIAEHLSVSTRTVLRELNGIENWLNKNNIALEKKKGIGIRINPQEKDRKALLKYIQSEKSDLVYSPEERLSLLKAELLKNPGVTKLYTLTRLFEVTEATISSDIDKLEDWMNKYNLEITKKPGLGVYVKGNEINIRSAVISLVYEQFHEAELINLIFNKGKDSLNIDMIKTRINQSILDILDLRILVLAQKFLSNIEKQMNCQFADNSYIALIIRISVTIHRCRQGKFIEEMSDTKAEAPEDKLFYLVKELFTSQENPLADIVPEAEINYLVIHIKGAETQEKSGLNKEQSLEDAGIYELTKEIIYIAERETGIYLEDNERLFRGLANHLKMAVYRIKMHLDIMNPLLEDIKEMYPDLFLAAAKCAAFIAEREQISIPEDEIAYLASHIGAAVKEEKNNAHQTYSAVVICTNDMGAAQLLVSEIEREFPNIKITSIISIMDIAGLTRKHIDLIITTVELQIAQLPVILVNPILNEGDRKKIRDVLENFLPEPVNYGRLKNIQLEEKLKGLKSYSDYILQIIHNFLFIEQVAAKDMEELSHFISRTVTKTGADRFQIEKDLKVSQKKGAAILGSKGMILFHCHSEAVQELGMVILRMKDSVNSPDKALRMLKADTVIVLTMPYDPDNYAREILNEITRKIINTEFAAALKQRSKEEVMIELNGILDYFIQNKALETNTK